MDHDAMTLELISCISTGIRLVESKTAIWMAHHQRLNERLVVDRADTQAHDVVRWRKVCFYWRTLGGGAGTQQLDVKRSKS